MLEINILLFREIFVSAYSISKAQVCKILEVVPGSSHLYKCDKLKGN